MPEKVTNLRSYMMPEGDILEPVKPVPLGSIKMVAISQSDAEILQNVGEGLCRLGATEAGLALIGVATQWEIL